MRFIRRTACAKYTGSSSIREDLILPLVNRGVKEEEANEKARYFLDRVGLQDSSRWPVSKLSFGQRKRAAIAAALITNPEILLLDEPTAELDGRSVRELQDLLNSLRTTLVLVTHDHRFARDLTERALLLSSGLVLADSPTESIPDDLLTHTGIL
jgi:cobalt/nickel transport system ATP-binding protein